MSIFAPNNVEAFMEWDLPNSDVPIRQGDLLVKKDGVATQYKDVVLVITADCDFAQRKHEGALAALRVISFADYVRHRWAQAAYEAVVEQDLPELTATFNKQRQETDGAASITMESFARWLERETPEAVCSEITDEKRRAKALEAAKKAHVLLGLSDPLASDAPFDRYLAYQQLRTNSDAATARSQLLKRARDGLSTLPGDLFYVSQLPVEGSSSHLVMLRELIPISVELATASAVTARQRNGYLRIGRLKPAFKYALSQQFGLMFSRVGLPETYETSKRSFLKSFEV